MVAVGIVPVAIRLKLAGALHPVVVFVTVTVYVPTEVAILVLVVSPVAHTYVTPVAGEAVKVAVGSAHVKLLLVAIEGVGKAIRLIMIG